MTEDVMPTPIAAPNATGSVIAGAASAMPNGNATTAATSMAIAKPSIPESCTRREARWATTM
jgi:hypothetical protein